MSSKGVSIAVLHRAANPAARTTRGSVPPGNLKEESGVSARAVCLKSWFNQHHKGKQYERQEAHTRRCKCRIAMTSEVVSWYREATVSALATAAALTNITEPTKGGKKPRYNASTPSCFTTFLSVEKEPPEAYPACACCDHGFYLWTWGRMQPIK